MNLMTGELMSSLIGAASQVELAKTPTTIYRQEANKLNPNQEILDRSGGYANHMLTSAMEEAEKAGAQLEKAQTESTAQEKAESSAKLQQVGKNEPSKTAVGAETTIKQPVDTIELSEEGKIALINKAASNTSRNEPVVASTEAITPHTASPKTYTSLGTAEIMAADHPAHKMSVTV